MRRCVPGGTSVLNWFQNSGGWSFRFQAPSSPRGLNTRSFARIDSSSRRMPAITPWKPNSFITFFRPRVLRAAERAAGGRVGSTSSTGGQGRTIRFRSHSAA